MPCKSEDQNLDSQNAHKRLPRHSNCVYRRWRQKPSGLPRTSDLWIQGTTLPRQMKWDTVFTVVPTGEFLILFIHQYLTPSAFQECYLVGYILRIPKATASDRGLFCLMLMPTLAWIYVSKKTELGELRVGVITKHTVKKRFVQAILSLVFETVIHSISTSETPGQLLSQQTEGVL